MAKILFTNGAQTVLNGAITNSATTLAVVSLTGFPSSLAVGEFFYIAIEDELIKITAMSGTTWTAVRGVDGTTGAAHADVTIVTGILNKEAMDYLRDSIPVGGGGGGGSSVTYGPIASLPAAGTAGSVYVPSDSYYASLHDNGSGWVYRSMGGQTCTPPNSASFSIVNSLTASPQTNGGIVLTSPATSGIQVRHYVATAPATPYTRTFRIHISLLPVPAHNCGVVMRVSASSKFMAFGVNYGSGIVGSIAVQRWTNNTTWSANPLLWNQAYQAFIGATDAIFRIADDGTNLNFYMSTDGINFLQIYTETRAAFLGAAPDQIGVFMDTSNTSYPATCVFVAMD